MDQHGLQKELVELRAELAALRRRVDRLEGAPSDERAGAAGADRAAPARPAHRAAATFTGLAVICFTLVGALVLRVATEQAWLGPALGVGLGLGYCGLLLVGPLVLVRSPFMAAYGGAMQACAVLVAPAILLETHYRQGLLSAGESAAGLIAFGLGAGVAGAALDRRWVAGLGLLAAMLALAGLGLGLDAARMRALGLVGLLACALLVAHARGWPALRSLAVLAAGGLLGVAVLATAHRQGVGPAEAAFILAAAGGAWLLVAVSHQARWARVSAGEAAWLPLGTAWMAGLVVFHSGGAGAAVALGIGLGLVAIALWRLRTAGPAGPAAVGLGVAGGLAAAIGGGVLDPTGLGLAAVALAWLWIGRTAGSNLLAVASQLALIGGVIRFLASARPFEPGRPGVWIWPVAALLFVLAGAHARLAAGRARTPAGAWLAPLSLAAALAVGYGAASAGLLALAGPGDGYRFGTTGMLALAASACLLLGSSPKGPRGLYGLGLLALGLSAIKVLLVDLLSMGGAPLLGSFVALGAAFGVTSLAMRRRFASAAGSKDPADPDATG